MSSSNFALYSGGITIVSRLPELVTHGPTNLSILSLGRPASISTRVSSCSSSSVASSSSSFSVSWSRWRFAILAHAHSNTGLFLLSFSFPFSAYASENLLDFLEIGLGMADVVADVGKLGGVDGRCSQSSRFTWRETECGRGVMLSKEDD